MADSSIKPAEVLSERIERPFPDTKPSPDIEDEPLYPNPFESKDEPDELDEIPSSDLENGPPVAASTVVPIVVSGKDPLDARIEETLSEDLTDAFLNMSPELQEKFKEKGEETAGKIRRLLEQTKVSAHKIFQLIREWLRMVPGINRFFLEQEAKIKTDKILRLKP
jgi:hypothetical protein